MKTMQDIKAKGKARLNHFNQKLEHVREADRVATKNKKPVEARQAKPVQDLDKVLDKEISSALNGIQGALTQIYHK